MTGGTMKCPKCSTQFIWADYVDGKWTEFQEPWKCPKCGSLIVLDREKGYGLKLIEENDGQK